MKVILSSNGKRHCLFYLFLLFLEVCHAVIVSVNLCYRCCRKEVRAHQGTGELHFLFYFFRLLCILPIFLDADEIFLTNDVLNFIENLILVIHSWLNCLMSGI